MKRQHKNPRKYTATPQKPELEIVSSSSSDSDETTVPGATQGFIFEGEGTSIETMEETTFTAPIRMPPREKLALDMVPSDLVYKYDEYRSDESKMSAAFYAFLGAFIGVIINWATASPPIISTVSIIIELILLIAMTFFGVFAYTFNRRAKGAKLKIDSLAKR